jgi:hypothetical protein
MDVHMGNEGTKSNGHGKGKEERMNLVETIKNMKKYVHSYKSNNERLMKCQGEAGGLQHKVNVDPGKDIK